MLLFGQHLTDNTVYARSPCCGAGQTLGTLIYRVHENEDNILELDFSYLALRNKRLESHGADLVARALSTNRTVLKLVMRDHDIGDAGAVAIANMLRVNSTLEYIDLYGNNISDEGAEAIAHALYGHESVTYLSMWSNQISNRGALALAEALKCNTALKYLGLVHNRISESGASAFLEALDVNIHLETLNLAKNQLTDATTYKIRVALARNRCVCCGGALFFVWHESADLLSLSLFIFALHFQPRGSEGDLGDGERGRGGESAVRGDAAGGRLGQRLERLPQLLERVSEPVGDRPAGCGQRCERLLGVKRAGGRGKRRKWRQVSREGA